MNPVIANIEPTPKHAPWLRKAFALAITG